MSDAPSNTCIYPGCERAAMPPHPLGGPPSSFCDLEEHNALTAHQERQRLAREAERRDQCLAPEAKERDQRLAPEAEQHDNEEVDRGR